MAAGSGAGQDRNVVNAWSSGRCWQMKLKCFSSLFRYSCCSALRVLCAFDPRLADYTRLRGLDRPTRTDVNEPYTQKILLIPVVPTNHVVSYDGQIAGVNCQSPAHTQRGAAPGTRMTCLTGYCADWGRFRAEGQNFSFIPSFFETSPLWIYCICSFNKVLPDIALAVFSCSHSLPQVPETGFVCASIPELESGWGRKGTSSSSELATFLSSLQGVTMLL